MATGSVAAAEHVSQEAATNMDQRVSRPFTATAAISARMRELGMRDAAELADRAGVDCTTVRYFGWLAHDQETFERLSVALDWPRGRLAELWSGHQ
jgi:hypothetical protein